MIWRTNLTFRLLDMALLLLFGGDPPDHGVPGFTGLRVSVRRW